jgi:hypothetical protein
VLFEVFETLGEVLFERIGGETYGGVEALVEFKLVEAAAYGAGLEEVVFAIVGAATYGVDVGRKQLVFATSDIVGATK